VLESAGLEEATVLVVALDDAEATTRLVAAARRRRPDLRIVARAEDRAHAHALSHAGADEVLREVFDSSVRAGRHVLEALGFDPQRWTRPSAPSPPRPQAMRELRALAPGPGRSRERALLARSASWRGMSRLTSA
jgi:hypothetical protein